MSLRFAAIAPHTPMLLPAVSKENSAALQVTDLAYRQLINDLAAKKIETVVIISPLGFNQPSVNFFNIAPSYQINFESFGDLTTNLSVTGDILLGHELKKVAVGQHNIKLSTSTTLDNGSAVLAFYLRQSLPQVKILPFYPSNTPLNDLFTLGQSLKNGLESSPKKIAVLAVGGLSQKLNKLSPAGYSPKARAWDKKIINALLTQQTEALLQQDDTTREAVKELCLSPVVTLLGCIAGLQYKPKQLSYEYPFGVGLLVMEFLF